MPKSQKIEKYRQLAYDLVEIGKQQQVYANTPARKMLFQYFVRLGDLVFGTIACVEANCLGGAYALEKSIFDAVLRGLFLGYVATEAEIKTEIEKVAKGQFGGYSAKRQTAEKVDKALHAKRPAMQGRIAEWLGIRKQMLNEYQHGGLASTVLSFGPHPAEFENGIMGTAAMDLNLYLSIIFLVEGLDVRPLEEAMLRFDDLKQLAAVSV